MDRRPIALARVASLGAVLLLASACAHPYPDVRPRNVEIDTRTEAGFLGSVRTYLDVYDVASPCEREHLGVVKLNRPSQRIGLAVGEPRQLVFRFDTSSWLSNQSSSIHYDTTLTPRAGYEYDVDVRYADDIYEVAVRETDPRRDRTRTLDREPLACAE